MTLVGVGTLLSARGFCERAAGVPKGVSAVAGASVPGRAQAARQMVARATAPRSAWNCLTACKVYSGSFNASVRMNVALVGLSGIDALGVPGSTGI